MSRYWFKVVTRPGEGLGFRMAGAAVEGGEEGGVVAGEEELLERVPEALLQKVGREGVPVLLPFTFPRRWEEGGRGEEYVATLIRRAIGYPVKIQRGNDETRKRR